MLLSMSFYAMLQEIHTVYLVHKATSPSLLPFLWFMSFLLLQQSQFDSLASENAHHLISLNVKHDYLSSE